MIRHVSNHSPKQRNGRSVCQTLEEVQNEHCLYIRFIREIEEGGEHCRQSQTNDKHRFLSETVGQEAGQEDNAEELYHCSQHVEHTESHFISLFRTADNKAESIQYRIAHWITCLCSHQPQFIEEGKQCARIHIILKVVVHCASPHGKGREKKERQDEHRPPGNIPEYIPDILLGISFLICRRRDTFTAGEEGNNQEHETDDCK